MAWIESHQSLSRHRKTIRAAGRLAVDRHKLIGHLQELWWWAIDNTNQHGDLGDLSDTEIAMAAEWDGDPGEFVAALTDAGFIDADADGRCLHDWHDYAGKLMEDRARERERSRRRRLGVREMTGGRPAVGQQTTAGTVPYRTLPYRTDLRSTAATTIDPTVSDPAPPPAEAAGSIEAAAVADAAEAKTDDAGTGHAALNRIEGYLSQITGRLIPSPLDMQHMREALLLCRGDAEFVAQVMGAVSNAYKPRFPGDKIRTFSYFLPAIREAAALRAARAGPIHIGERLPPSAEEQEKLRAMTAEILAALPAELLVAVDEDGGERHERSDTSGCGAGKHNPGCVDESD